jgi:hypothetical protein
MSIYPDKKDGVVTGRWRVEVQLGSMRKRGRFDTMAEAKAAEASWQVQLASGSTEDATSRDTGTKTLLQLLAKAAPMLWTDQEARASRTTASCPRRRSGGSLRPAETSS